MLHLYILFSQDFSCYPCTCFCIGKGMMMIFQMIATKFGNCMELMILCIGECTTRSNAGTIEGIIGIIHLITMEYSLQTTLIEGFVVGNKRQTFNKGFYLCPHYWENGSVFRIFSCEAMHLGAPEIVIVGFWMNEGIEGVCSLTITHNYNAHTANAGTFIIRCFKIYRCKVFH